MAGDGLPGTAGVRRLDGTLVFVGGVPASARVGDTAVFALGQDEERGTVAIPPSQLVWCGEVGAQALFVSLEPCAEAGGSVEEVPLAVFQASTGAAGETDLAAMLRLAREELTRLDNP